MGITRLKKSEWWLEHGERVLIWARSFFGNASHRTGRGRADASNFEGGELIQFFASSGPRVFALEALYGQINENQTSKMVAESAIEVHRKPGGPGLLEGVYKEAIVEELPRRGL